MRATSSSKSKPSGLKNTSELPTTLGLQEVLSKCPHVEAAAPLVQTHQDRHSLFVLVELQARQQVHRDLAEKAVVFVPPLRGAAGQRQPPTRYVPSQPKRFYPLKALNVSCKRLTKRFSQVHRHSAKLRCIRPPSQHPRADTRAWRQHQRHRGTVPLPGTPPYPRRRGRSPAASPAPPS